MTNSKSEKYEFQAEVKQVLDIVVHSLYTDKEIFIRELISNASDATEKLRHTQLTEKSILQEDLALSIKVHSDSEKNEISIQDHGIGMTREELVENLGTIAHSGSKAFLKAIQESGEKNENLIGQFGVGFYSVFMVADSVDVYTRSWKTEGEALCWSSDGSGSYEIKEVEEALDRGTKIVIHLKDSYKEFTEKTRLETVINNYSAFIQFPIQVNDETLKTMGALWLKNKKDISDEEYKEFYKFQSKAFDDPQFWLHFNADAPLEINALLFTPTENMEGFGFGRMEPGVSLYCKKVLIDEEPKNLIPEWLRFLRGVVDSSDLPLNISRESMQDSTLVQKLNKVLTKRYLKQLEEKANKEPETYDAFWKRFGIFLKEGVTSDFTHREQLLNLLRFESTYTKEGETTSLSDYLSRAHDNQKEIYFLFGANRNAIEKSPYLEAFNTRKIEVLLTYEPIDEFVINHARSFKENNFVSADSAEIDLESISKADEPEGEALDPESEKALCEYLKETLSDIKEVSTSTRLINSPAMIVNSDKMMTAQMKKMMKAMQKTDGLADEASSIQLEVNSKHPLIKNLANLYKSDSELSELIARQILDTAKISAGLIEDPSSLVERNYKIMEKLSTKATKRK
jgi:TNF receptor-associated protein 1